MSVQLSRAEKRMLLIATLGQALLAVVYASFIVNQMINQPSLLNLAIYGGLVLLISGSAILVWYRRAWAFCIVIAALMSMIFPVGTLVGVFSLFVLLQEDIRLSFSGQTENE